MFSDFVISPHVDLGGSYLKMRVIRGTTAYLLVTHRLKLEIHYKIVDISIY